MASVRGILNIQSLNELTYEKPFCCRALSDKSDAPDARTVRRVSAGTRAERAPGPNYAPRRRFSPCDSGN